MIRSQWMNRGKALRPRLFATLPYEMGRELRKAVLAGTKDTYQSAKAVVPVDTGALRKLIEFRMDRKDITGVVFVNDTDGTETGYDVQTIRKIYAVEFGRHKYNQQDAQPFMRVAADATADSNRARIKKAFRNTLARVRRKKGKE